MKISKKISLTTMIFFIVAFLFLAIGLGSLGSVYGSGKAYELRLKGANDAKDPAVIFELENPSYVNDKGVTVTDYYRVAHVYLNVAAIYNDETEKAKISLSRGASPTASAFHYDAELANIAYEQKDTLDKDGNVVEDKTVMNAVGNWIEPFDLSVTASGNLNVSPYKYYKLSAGTCNMLINEIVFVGEKLTSASGEGTDVFEVIPVKIYSAPPLVDDDETEETANRRAAAMLDAQRIPSMAQSSFFRLGKEEVPSMITAAEMRLGNRFYEPLSGNASNVYHGDKVYNSLGVTLVGLGVLIFGNSPFGLRFFPMLASFGILVMGYLFVCALTKSKKAGLVFAVLYALSGMTLGLGHLGTPLTVGIFFFLCSLYFVYSFYNKGITSVGAKGVLPLVLSGLFCAAAICVNGVYALAALAPAGLFAAGMVRQYKARRFYLDEAIAFAEAEKAAGVSAPVAPAESEEAADADAPYQFSEGEKRVMDVVAEYRWKNRAAIATFFTAIVIGATLLSLLFLLPVYMPYVKLYDNPANPRSNVFELMWKLFAGGFVGSNGGMCAFHPFYKVFTGAGSMFAVTAIVANTVALLAGLLGVAYAVYKVVLVCMKKIQGKEARIALRRAAIPAGLIVIGLICASFGGGALGFIALIYVGLFMLAAECVRDAREREWKGQKVAKILTWVGLGLLAAVFLLFAVFTFSIPLPALFMSNFV